MKPLNQAERKKAFGNFLILFIITIGVIIMVVFFSIRVPFEENQKMKNQLAVYQDQQKFAAEFSGRVSYIQSLIDTLVTPNLQTGRIEDQITISMTDLQTFKEKNMPGNDNVYFQLVDALYKLKTANSGLAKANAQSPDLGKMQQEASVLNQRIDRANNYIITLSSQVGMKPPYQSF